MRPIVFFATLLPTLWLLSACSEAPKHQISWAQVPEHGFEHDEVVELGRLVLIDYALFDDAPDNSNPELPNHHKFPTYKQLFERYTPILNLQAHDNPRAPTRVLYGHIWQDTLKQGHLIISLRGTDDSQEWIDDAKFEMVNYRADDCCVELGFDEIYRSLTVTTPPSLSKISEKDGSENNFLGHEMALMDYLKTQNKINTITVVGHSLGSSIATLTAFHADDAVDRASVKLLTFASPLTGDQAFVASLQGKIKQSVRIVNQPDIVPRMPLTSFGYRHIWHEFTINSNSRKHIVDSIACHHSLNTYLHILDASVPLAAHCLAKG